MNYILISLLAIFLPIISLYCLLCASKTFRQLWFAWLYSEIVDGFVRDCHILREKLFKNFVDENLTILEIGPAGGHNFEFYPPNTRLIAVDHNGYFKKYFIENNAKFPHISCEKFITSKCENMAEIADESVDVVVATYLLCSVGNMDTALSEIKRVLKRGGRYYFAEHVGFQTTNIKTGLIYALQLAVYPFWFPLVGGCCLHRKSWLNIEKAGFESARINFLYPKEILWCMRAQMYGIATKKDQLGES